MTELFIIMMGNNGKSIATTISSYVIHKVRHKYSDTYCYNPRTEHDSTELEAKSVHDYSPEFDKHNEFCLAVNGSVIPSSHFCCVSCSF